MTAESGHRDQRHGWASTRFPNMTIVVGQDLLEPAAIKQPDDEDKPSEQPNRTKAREAR